jgi:tetratricopeptide (TPR) repeat protein
VLLLLLLIGINSSNAAEADLATATRAYQDEKFDAALAALDRFDSGGAATADSLDLRGCINLEQQKFGEAEKAFTAAHEAKPEVFAPRLHLADLLMRQKKFEEARAAYQALLHETNILVSSERLRFAVMLAYLGEKNEDEARRSFDRITFPTQSPAYYYAQAAWAFAHGKKSEGDDWMKQAGRVYQSEAPLWFARHLYDFGWLKRKPPLPKAHD